MWIARQKSGHQGPRCGVRERLQEGPSAGAVFGLCEGEPGLVVSGSSSGNNVANSVTDSGTVGATIAAIEEDIPSVAVSSASNDAGTIFPVENYPATAQWGARFLIGLREQGTSPLR
ncbi:MAG: 5'/3'-nucleotidase SurE [Microlunatus sp.]